ncbi:FRG domain-containing protein [Staphylococcus gallinarum]|uniref:FRG domain-containing protein n=1 Tax=Staphylococcus gallinarum TaxID=1293 RepID=UPI001E3CA722|nr:FRG domain-containing protein [Staphylococcus gallinarum]MCD8920855.1 FRG domain-containing protein [Staphylococcus gallinarum]UEH01124.1 FRG domain-containing protein [Staphylococcus gallinarum]
MNIYDEISEKINKISLYNDIKIKIIVIPNDLSNDQEDSKRFYKIDNIEVDFEKSENEDLNTKIKSICNNLKVTLKNKSSYSWQIFYFIKELFQLIDSLKEGEKGNNFNYYRGQSSDWDALPGILRPYTNQEYVTNFEQEYKKLAYNYPNELSYLPYTKENRLERTNYLSILQHYGMQTSLLDITKNPYIALLFMVSVENKYQLNKPTFFMYEINEDIHHDSHLFVRVIKDVNNKRIEAQKGAFLGYDYLYSLNLTSIKKINRIILEINVDEEYYKKKLENDLDALSRMEHEYKNEVKEDNKLSEAIEYTRNFINNILKQISCEEKIQEKKDECYEQMREEILKKLREYHYFENQLYPDLDKQILYVLSRYKDKTQKMYISDL